MVAVCHLTSQQSFLAPPAPDAAQKPPSAQDDSQKNKIAAVQQELDLTKGILQENILAVQERGERMDVLQNKTGLYLNLLYPRSSGSLGNCDLPDNLAIHSQTFNRQAVKVRRKMWWKNTKWMIILAIFIAIVIAAIVGSVFENKDKFRSSN
ncbi:hypothetical protein P7C73_g5374, partial [Tremellales sp. Uapishka_1]